jgi:hypothetical protein
MASSTLVTVHAGRVGTGDFARLVDVESQRAKARFAELERTSRALTADVRTHYHPGEHRRMATSTPALCNLVRGCRERREAGCPVDEACRQVAIGTDDHLLVRREGRCLYRNGDNRALFGDQQCSWRTNNGGVHQLRPGA